ncbi:MAG: ABC transporter, partial [Mesorhizobium sp.]
MRGAGHQEENNTMKTIAKLLCGVALAAAVIAPA